MTDASRRNHWLKNHYGGTERQSRKLSAISFQMSAVSIRIFARRKETKN
jgi:hypothetical protein